MKSRRQIIGLLILTSIPWTAFTQQKLSKDEILNVYRSNRPTPKIDSIFRWNIQSNTRASLDNLLKTDVDTLVVYSISFPGYAYLGKKDSCMALYPTNSYFFWKKSGEYSYKDTDGLCQSQVRDSDGKVVKFAVDNFGKISNEFFIGVVTGGEKNGESTRLKENLVNHEAKYSILVIIRDQYNYLTFTESGLTNKASLFLDYNKGLISYKLFELIKSEIGSD